VGRRISDVSEDLCDQIHDHEIWGVHGGGDSSWGLLVFDAVMCCSRTHYTDLQPWRLRLELNNQLKTSRFAFQIDGATDVDEDAHLITYEYAVST
jgi:hypothetical protein